jgi:hypothetical protein
MPSMYPSFTGQPSGCISHTTGNDAVDPEIDLRRAIVHAVAYSDIFDYPLTAAEVHRYLVGRWATLHEVQRVLQNGELIPQLLRSVDGHFTFPGRERLVATRQERERRSLALWPLALEFGRQIASAPFVRMVAVTGELAMNNARAGSDIDYLIVTRPGRLWLARLLIIGIVRTAALRGVTLCPNYILSENALVIEDENLFTAHEMAQMVCLFGWETYARMRHSNSWVYRYLPNATIGDGPPQEANGSRLRAAAETLLSTRPIGWIEEWEMNRKIRKFARSGAMVPEARFSPEWCKGHFEGHGRRTLDAYAQRAQKVEEWLR